MKVLLTGASGQLGSHLREVLPVNGHELLAMDSASLDISSREQVLTCASDCPDVIVNAAAYTAVDKAESDVDKAFAVNEVGVRHLVELAKLLNIPLINVSTDYVFDGRASVPYVEDYPVSPLGVYGNSKRAGEALLESSDVLFVNIRTSWVFSEYGNNFLKTMLRLGCERDSLSVVSDQIGCPTYAGDLAVAINNILFYYSKNKTLTSGHFHYCGDQQTSWFGFAEYIFSIAKSNRVISMSPQLSPIVTKEYPTPAIRPLYSVLNTQKIRSTYGCIPSDWKSAANKVIARLAT
ncbi:dTDP-4-dehydrorhamnose reductase [Bacterioplanoides sp.]|uniref:dTDP-4-dehydrorhamnose reductase n=1 Tax=Bacterioplanoides sp. TaxID=2066072 RepID=UPI003B002F09